ncbi:MAG: sugar transferase [Deltaproteobacteria bacterium]|nr:sugar transferase [Deltaproteobacteria bacterium]
MFFDLFASAGLFLGLLLHPAFHRTGALVSEGGLSATVALGLVAVIAVPLLLGHLGIYESHRREQVGSLLFRLAAADAAGGLVLGALAFSLNAPVAPHFPVVFASALFAVQALARVPAFLILRALRRSGRNFRNVLIVGAGPRAAEATQSIFRNPEWGQRIVGYLDNGEQDFAPLVPVEKIHKFIDLPGLLRDETIDEVLVACPRTVLVELTPVVRECAMIGVPVTLLTDLFGDQLPPPRVGAFDTLRTLSFAPVHHNEIELLVKRGIDILGGLVGVALSAPIIGLAAIFIKSNSKGPIFFRQVRSGLNGRRFEMLKLRTMAVDADDRKHELLHLNEMDGPVFKIRNDPRITSAASTSFRSSGTSCRAT